MQRRPTMLVALSVAALVVAVAGCSNRPTILIGAAPYTVGSDRLATNERTVEPFNEIEANSAVRVVVKVGTTPAVEVATDDNLLPLIRTSVAAGRLTIDIDGSISTHLGVDVTVVAPNLDSIVANASAVVRAEGTRHRRSCWPRPARRTCRSRGPWSTSSCTCSAAPRRSSTG